MFSVDKRMPLGRPSLRPYMLVGCFALAGMGLAQTTPPASSSNAPAPAKPAEPAKEKPKTSAAQPFAKPEDKAPPAIVYGGNLDVYYGYNFNKPPVINGVSTTGPGARNFDQKNDLISLGLAEFSISRPTTEASPFGFTLKLGYGPTLDLLTSAGDADNKNILQAYGTYAIPSHGKTVTVDIGKFATEVGYEVTEPGLNANFSRSYLFQYFGPYYHAGVRAGIPLSDKLTGNLYVYNGWNNVSFDTNANKALGVGLTFNPDANTSVILNGLTSREPAGLSDQPKTVLEVIGSHNFTSKLAGAVDFNYDFGKGTLVSAPAVPDSNWSAYGVAAYLKYMTSGGSYLAVRGEYIKDKDSFIFGGNGVKRASEITVTYSWQHALFPNSELRFEFRHDDADANGLFMGSGGALNKTKQDTITLSHIFRF